MVRSLCSSALFLALIASSAPLHGSAGPVLPLPVKIEELASVASACAATPSLASSQDLSPAGQEHGKHIALGAVPGLPLAASTRVLSFPDGMRLVVFRQGEGSADSDVYTLTLDQEARWSAPQRLGREGWRETVSSKPPFSVSQYSPRATVAWYTEADNEPRILVSQTPDAGQRWTAAMRADLGLAAGPLSQVTLSDASILLCWLEKPGDDASLPGGFYLRRYAPNGASAMPALLAIVAPSQLSAGPELSVLEDHGDGTGVLQLSYAEAGVSRSLRITLPERAVLEELDHSCRCGPPQDPGHALRARIISLDTKAGTALLAHGALPGLLRPGELRVKLPSESLAGLQPGDELLGRIQAQAGVWHLLAPRRLGGRP